jgi:hypothetical protein
MVVLTRGSPEKQPPAGIPTRRMPGLSMLIRGRVAPNHAYQSGKKMKSTYLETTVFFGDGLSGLIFCSRQDDGWYLLDLPVLFVFYVCFFGTENDVLDSLPKITINKGRWMLKEHKIFMEEYEKYGNNCTLIAKVLNTRTPAQIKKHAECFFQQNLKTYSAAVKQYQEFISPDKKAQILITNATEQQNYRGSLSPEKKSNFMQ